MWYIWNSYKTKDKIHSAEEYDNCVHKCDVDVTLLWDELHNSS